MRLLFVATIFFLGTATEYHRPRDNQFQIQGVIIEDPPRIYRYKRQQFQSPFYRQSRQPPPYLERPSAPTFQRPLPPAPTNFQNQRYRQQPVSPSQQPFQRAPSPQPQFPQSSFSQYQPPQQQAYRPPQPQPAFSQSQSWTPNRRVFSEVSNYSPEPSRGYNPTSSSNGGHFGGGLDSQRGGGIEANGDYNGARYYYPPKQPFPLPKCFHNPTGYVCCNQQLNDLIVETYSELEKRPKFHTCNVNALAYHIQQRAEKRFNNTFETIAAYDDFAQKIHFKGDFVCKVELGGKYMLAYATVSQAMDDTLRPLPSHRPIPHLESVQQEPIHLSRRSNVMLI